jgi:hypothetical protein
MTTQDTTTDAAAGESRDFANLRRTADKQAAQIRDLEDKLLRQAAAMAGYDPEQGITKLVLADFRRQYPDVPADPDTFRAFAEHQGHKPTTEATSSDGGGQRPAAALTIDDEIRAAEAAGNWDASAVLKTRKLLAQERASSPAAAPSIAQPQSQQRLATLRQEIAAAEDAGDWATSGRLKSQWAQMRAAADGPNGGAPVGSGGGLTSDQANNWGRA